MSRTHAFHLTRGDDLLLCVQAYARERGLAAAAIVSAVGCLTRWRMRCADGVTVMAAAEPVEIVSATGTVSANGCHVHIALAREDLSVIGGHLVEGCVVNTTAEVVLLELEGLSFSREQDAITGYNELVIKKDCR